MNHTPLGIGTPAAIHAQRIEGIANQTIWAEAAACFHDVKPADVLLSGAQVRHVLLAAGYNELLAACKATCAAIEFRGKALLAGYDELDEDESNWRDGVEPYLLELYEQNRAIAKAAEGDG